VAPPVLLQGYDALVPASALQRPRRTGRTFLATFAVLALASAAGVRFYDKLPLPWNSRAFVAAHTSTPAPAPAPTPTVATAPASESAPAPAAAPGAGDTTAAPAAAPPAPSPEELRAEREHAAKEQLDKLLAGGTKHLPALEKLLARWSSDEKDPVAKSSRTLARARLLELAQTDLQKEDFDAAKAHFRIGLSVSGPSEDANVVREYVRQSAIDAIKAGNVEKAVTWARQGLALAGHDDADAHALLADTLYAARQYKDSVDEYRLAIAGKPDDDTFKRGLERARKKAGPEKPARPRGGKARVAKSKAAAKPAAAGEPAAAEPEEDAGKPAPSAPSETATDEQ
jgi:tetratricopeptide (TPR) repeat protein